MVLCDMYFKKLLSKEDTHGGDLRLIHPVLLSWTIILCCLVLLIQMWVSTNILTHAVFTVSMQIPKHR